MKRRIWMAALAVGLGWSLSNLRGQETTWRTATASTPPPKVRAVSGAAPSASLGRPVPITRGASAEPRLFPEVYRQEAAPIRFHYGGIQPIATVPAPGAVIAVSSPSRPIEPVAPTSGPVTEEYHEPPYVGDLFAMDRVEPPVSRVAQPTMLPTPPLPSLPVPETPLKPNPSSLSEKFGNWQNTVSSTLPGMTEPLGDLVFSDELPPTKWYLRGEYLLWWMKNDRVPPLVTTTSIPNPDRDDETIGTIGSPATVVLFGGGDLNRNPFSGARAGFGYYLDDCGEKAIEISGFILGQRSDGFRSNSFQNSVLTRPFLQVNPPPIPNAQRVSFPGDQCGEVRIKAPSQLWGVEPNFLCKYCCDCNYRVDLLGGFRYLNLRESISIEEDVIFDGSFDGVDAQGRPLANNQFFASDRFATSNQFYGAQLGVEGRWQRDRFTVDGRAKLAVGVTQQTLDINGFQIRRLPNNGGIETYQGGLLALPNSNIGHYEKERFSFVPEISVSVGYYLTERLRATFGYNVLYWSNVMRPGNQIDTALDVNLIPNFRNTPLPPAVPTRPVAPLTSTDLWVQGITAGLEYRY